MRVIESVSDKRNLFNDARENDSTAHVMMIYYNTERQCLNLKISVCRMLHYGLGRLDVIHTKEG